MVFQFPREETQIFSQVNDDIILIHQDSMKSMNFNSCNCYLVKINEEDFAIVDPGCSKRKFITTLKQNKIDYSNLKYFYVTHGHSDHVALIDFIRKKNEKIEGYIHYLDKKYLESPHDYYNMLFDISLIQKKEKYHDFINAITYYSSQNSNLRIKQSYKIIFDLWNVKSRNIEHTFKDGDKLPGNLDVIHAPGHTPGMCFFFNEEDKILFSSDIHLSKIGVSVSGKAGDFRAFKSSIDLALQLVNDGGVKIILSGHGKNPITENLKDRLIGFKGIIEFKEKQITALLKNKDPMTLDDITNESFKEFINRVEKYLDHENFKDTIAIAEASEMMYNLNVLRELERQRRIKKLTLDNKELWTLF